MQNNFLQNKPTFMRAGGGKDISHLECVDSFQTTTTKWLLKETFVRDENASS